MDEKYSSITITLRSFVMPPDAADDFPLGKPMSLRIGPGTSVGQLLERIFGPKADHIGLVAINGKIAEQKVLVADGDRVDVYELLGGG